jgi:drug/metabolite transporter (DMT)-like permease
MIAALGALLALGAALSYAVYVVAAKAALARTAPLPLAAMSFTIAAILLTLPLAWIDEPGTQLVRRAPHRHPARRLIVVGPWSNIVLGARVGQ